MRHGKHAPTCHRYRSDAVGLGRRWLAISNCSNLSKTAAPVSRAPPAYAHAHTNTCTRESPRARERESKDVLQRGLSEPRGSLGSGGCGGNRLRQLSHVLWVVLGR
jgi:hypothetical protein